MMFFTEVVVCMKGGDMQDTFGHLFQQNMLLVWIREKSVDSLIQEKYLHYWVFILNFLPSSQAPKTFVIS